ncbi:MAG: hypothetical protein RLZZ77_648 [Bacteroidota bacterium]|jgi:beta-glucanase (GH16 family)
MKARYLLISLLALAAIQAQAFVVTFQLDMRGVSGNFTPEVNGTFNNWCGSCNVMNDSDGDGIWVANINLAGGNYEYKYSFNNWMGQEDLISGSACTVTAGQFVNRTLQVTGDVVLPLVCWGNCSACGDFAFPDWPLVWADEFEGTEINPQIWTRQIGASGWGNNELQFYTNDAENAFVTNGQLHIEAIQENHQGSNYTSARLITNDLFEFKYGRLEANIKIPMGQGIWPAFWMLGANYETVNWPGCGEIDVMEHVNNEPLAHGTLHWQQGNNHNYQGTSLPIDTDEFHKYGIVWSETQIQFYIDSVNYYTYTFTPNNNTSPIFQRPFFLLLNIAVGGNWPGSPNAQTPFPAEMIVDYVHVYQDAAIGVNEDKELRFDFYPNPTSDFILVNAPQQWAKQNWRIMNINGQVVTSGQLDGEKTSIDLSSFASGNYVLQIIHQHGCESRLLIKE